MRPAIASIPSEGAVQKAPVIQRAVFRYILFNSLIFLTIGAPLKNQRLNLYSAMGKMHILYRSRFCMGSMPLMGIKRFDYETKVKVRSER